MRIAAAALALGVALAGCGGDSDREPPDEPPAELLRTAAANRVTSGEADLSFEAELEGDSSLAGDLGAEASGPFRFPAFDFQLDAEAAGFGFDGEVTYTGEDLFVVFFGENYRAGPELAAGLEDRLSAASGLDVAAWFRNPRYAGAEDVGGAETQRIEGGLDSRAAAQDLAALARSLGAPAPIEALAAGAGQGAAEAWVAYEDDTVRRVRAEFPFEVPPRAAAAAYGVTSGTVRLDAQISDAGAEAEISAPEGGGFQPLGQLIERLRDLASLGGLG